MIADAHIDLPYRLSRRPEDVSNRTDHGDFDYSRARAGGLDLAFMAIYVPATHQETGDSKAVADRLIDLVEALPREHPDKFAIVTGVAEARLAFERGLFGLALGLENGAALEGRLENLRHFHDRGIRYITLTHSRANDICDSSFDDERPWGGLSPFGRELIPEMNRLGVMVDVSHVTDQAFDQVLERSRLPPIASHSSCRHFTPGWERNLSDDSIRALAAAGGVIHINFGSSFINDEYRRRHAAARAEIRKELAARGMAEDSEAARLHAEGYFRAHPIPRARVDEVADHIEHVIGLVGLDHVGLGSDFEGLGDTLPEGLRDVSGYPNLIRVLRERGHTSDAIEKIGSGNLLRVWAEIERAAG